MVGVLGEGSPGFRARDLLAGLEGDASDGSGPPSCLAGSREHGVGGVDARRLSRLRMKHPWWIPSFSQHRMNLAPSSDPETVLLLGNPNICLVGKIDGSLLNLQECPEGTLLNGRGPR